ncbi:MAG: hypothetical protein F6J97_20775 [Leptolyngbya sp. SIO4C1]|nr:hypothetical protein [Leptolyngbya sp. SIO4C1]
MKVDQRMALSLLLLRWSVALVLLMWTIDKFVRPEHAAAVYENFYFIGGLGATPFYILGALELVLIVAFVAGFRKRLTYGLVLFIHAVSTLSAWRQYFAPFQDPNLLFFAAWPMLAGCFALYLLRDMDTIGTVD